MKITVAGEAGFCFGVKRATDFVERALTDGHYRVFLLGNLIHNSVYNAGLARRGARVIEAGGAERIAEDGAPVGIVIRAHGIRRQDEACLRALLKRYPNLRLEDMTCPFVKKIHRIVEENTDADTTLFVMGDSAHPEVQSIVSYAKGPVVVFPTKRIWMHILKKMRTRKKGYFGCADDSK